MYISEVVGILVVIDLVSIKNIKITCTGSRADF